MQTFASTGCRRLSFSGAADVAQRLAEMAEQLGAAVTHETAAPAMLELAPDDDAAVLVRARVQADLRHRNKA